MAKTQEELNALKEEIETLSKKLAELTDEEMKQVVGGSMDETNDCPYGKTKADKDCNFIYFDRRCPYAKLWIYSSDEYYNIYDCEKGCGRFDNKGL